MKTEVKNLNPARKIQITRNPVSVKKDITLADQQIELASFKIVDGKPLPISLLEGSVPEKKRRVLVNCLTLFDSELFEKFISTLNCNMQLLADLSDEDSFNSYVEAYNSRSTNFSQSASDELQGLVNELRGLPREIHGVPAMLANIIGTTYDEQSVSVLKDLLKSTGEDISRGAQNVHFYVKCDVASQSSSEGFSISKDPQDESSLKIKLTENQKKNLAAVNKFFDRFHKNATFEHKVKIMKFMADAIESSDAGNAFAKIASATAAAIATFLAAGVPVVIGAKKVKSVPLGSQRVNDVIKDLSDQSKE